MNQIRPKPEYEFYSEIWNDPKLEARRSVVDSDKLRVACDRGGAEKCDVIEQLAF
jgi:hypothetical protein